MIELIKTKLAMAYEIVRLRRALAWAWLAIWALGAVALGALGFAAMIARGAR